MPQAYTHSQARCHGYMQYFPTALKKGRKAIETEIDKRDEEITRADTKRAKANMSFPNGGGSRSSIELGASTPLWRCTTCIGHIVRDAPQQSALSKDDS